MSQSFDLLPQMSGNGYYSYSPMANQYGTPETVATLTQIARDYERNQRCRIGIGDMSHQNGGPMQHHRSHTDGKCADIRPLRTDKSDAPVTIQSTQYDRAGTALLVASLLAHRNVKAVLFNDRQIRGVTAWPGHDNHLHVTFKA